MDFDGLDFFGAETLESTPNISVGRTALAVGTGVLGALLVPKHPMLAFLNGAALASNLHAVKTGDRTLKKAIKRMGRHMIATAGSLGLPKYPVIGYIAGAIAGELVIDDEGSGIFEEWADYEGIRGDKKKDENIIDAEIVETNRALVKKEK